MNQEVRKRKWYNFFRNMRNKYHIRISTNRPLVLSLDARDKKNKSFNAIIQTAEYFSNRYKCIAIVGCNDVSFIIKDVESFADTINNEKIYKTQDIASVFSQYFFEYFNNEYKEKTIYWFCKCFNIPKEKVKSYIKFKSNKILKKEKIISTNQNVVLLYEGDRIDFQQYLNENIVKKIEEKKETEYLDLLEFDKLI